MTENELKELPSFMAEDGSRRYFSGDPDGECYTFDNYGRIVRSEYYGDIVIYKYDDVNHTVEKIYFWADYGTYGKLTYEMTKQEMIENCFKDDEEFEVFGLLNILNDESKEIMKQVQRFYRENPDYYPAPEEMFSILGLL